MTEGIEIKTPRRIKREGDKAPNGTQIRRTSVPPAGDNAKQGGGPPRPRPAVKNGLPPRPRPLAKKAPEGGVTPPAAPMRRPGTARPVRREKSLDGLGRLLKTKREIHGLTRRDVVVKIKIPLDQLEAIEEGRLSSLPPVFAKGFLRAYANELGLDAEAVLEDYRQLTGGFKNEPASRDPLAPRYVETSVGKTGGKSRFIKSAAIIILVLLIVGGLIIWLLPGLRSNLGSSLPALNQLPGFAGQDDSNASYTTLPAGDNNGADSSQASPANQGDESFLEDPIAETGLGGSLSDRGTLASAQAGGILTLSSKADRVWVQIQVDGQPLQFFWMKNGQQASWPAKQSITVTSGQANALSANWNGQILDELSSEPVAKVTFPNGVGL